MLDRYCKDLRLASIISEMFYLVTNPGTPPQTSLGVER